MNTTPSQTDPKTINSTEGGGSFITAKPEPKTEPKADADPKPEPKEGDPKPEPVAGAPEKYADFKLPEGYKFDDKELTKATTMFKEMNLSQESAQKLVDHYVENNLQAAKAPYDAWAKLQKDWGAEIQNRFGDRTDQVRSDINKAIDVVLPPSLARNFRAALDLTGAGTNPDLVEGLSLLFRPHYEGTPVKGGNPSPEGQRQPGSGPKSIAEAIYPHLANNR